MEQVMNIESLRPMSANIQTVDTKLNMNDILGSIKVRWGFGRDSYKVNPGLYKVGNPNSKSDVFVSANYKLSFDMLRKNLSSIDAWILVIDTKGVNVWCAAGKKTFGTENIINSIKNTSLENIVSHRKIIVPQLGAPGVAAHIVKEKSGFRVVYGPVRAKDISEFIANGYKSTPEMRKVTFPFYERAKLIPVDFMYRKYNLLLVIGITFILSGLNKTGLIFSNMINTSLYPIFNILAAYMAGIVIAPLLLPITPTRVFAIKGAIWGFATFAVINIFIKAPLVETIAIGLISIGIASFMMMNFTGSSTYTSLSGVKKEMKWALPIQISFTGIAVILFTISKLF